MFMILNVNMIQDIPIFAPLSFPSSPHISVIPCLFINAGVEPLIHVHIGDVEGLAGLRHVAGDALANGEPDGRRLLMFMWRGGDDDPCL